jgi:hypothetical protein
VHWDVLSRAGLPLGMPDDAAPVPSIDERARVTLDAIAEAAPAARATRSRHAVDDANRYLKLSRIAVANLARFL